MLSVRLRLLNATLSSFTAIHTGALTLDDHWTNATATATSMGCIIIIEKHSSQLQSCTGTGTGRLNTTPKVSQPLQPTQRGSDAAQQSAARAAKRVAEASKKLRLQPPCCQPPDLARYFRK